MKIYGLKTAIAGSTGSGKTYFAKWLARKFKKVLLYEVHTEFRDLSNVICYPQNLGNIDKFCSDAIKLAKNKKIDAVFIDEADMFLNTNFDITPSISDLLINHRHYNNLAIVLITRRPQDIPTRFLESSHNLVIFKIEGANVFSKLGQIDQRLPQLLADLKYQDYRFILKEIGLDPAIYPPISY